MFPASGDLKSDLFFYELFVFFLAPRVSENIHSLLCFVWLISVGIAPSCPIHIVANGRISLVLGG